MTTTSEQMWLSLGEKECEICRCHFIPIYCNREGAQKKLHTCGQSHYLCTNSLYMENSIHIIKRKKGWAIVKRSAKRALKVFDTKEEAFSQALVLRDIEQHLFIHNPDGTVDKWIASGQKSRHLRVTG